MHSPNPVLFLSDSRDARVAAVHRYLAEARANRPALLVIEDDSAAAWPFQREVTAAVGREGPSAPPGAVWVRDLHLAFPSGQTQGTRLVLTQSTYQMQRWLDWLDARPGTLLVADADLTAMRRSSPDAFAGRGPWARVYLVDVESAPPDREGTSGETGLPVPGRQGLEGLHAAFKQPDPERRVETCRAVSEAFPENPALRLAFASACMELQLLDEARTAVERAVSLAPDWEATHFERGKLLLRTEETEPAAAAFAEAARLMPRFAAALSNLGAALGELGRRAEALDALHRAIDVDPRGHLVLNNIGAVYREEGRLDDAAAAFRQVIALAPSFVFGYYNLGHTLFLRGDFEDARQVYEEGFARDPQKNARQACRLAVARVAARDADAAVELLEAVGGGLPLERRRELFEEAESTLDALSALPGIDAAALARARAVITRYSS